MSPEIVTFPKNERGLDECVFRIRLYDGEPVVIASGYFFHKFCTVNMILSLRKAMILKEPEREDKIDKEKRGKAVETLCKIGMPAEMAREFIDAVINRISGVVVRCKTRPLLPDELPEWARLGEHTGVEGSFEMIMPESLGYGYYIQ